MELGPLGGERLSEAQHPLFLLTQLVLELCFPRQTAAQLARGTSTVVVLDLSATESVAGGTLCVPDASRANRRCRSTAFSSLSLSSAACRRSAQS